MNECSRNVLSHALMSLIKKIDDTRRYASCYASDRFFAMISNCVYFIRWDRKSHCRRAT